MDERTEHLVELFEKMGYCESIEAERTNYDAIFAVLEGEGNTDGITALQSTFAYRVLLLRETLGEIPAIQQYKQAMSRASEALARALHLSQD